MGLFLVPVLPQMTLVLGASNNSDRYSYKAVYRLQSHGLSVIPVGVKKGEVAGLPILNHWPVGEEVDTVTLYINPSLQQHYYQNILAMKPRRVIFNPGTENEEFEKLLRNAGIEPIVACTLMLLASGHY
ncbi:MAG: CoA-binding protein [Flavobacteriaceae bacterium]|nr:CoA-binding protein [Flavobacteriaceae bacterium]